MTPLAECVARELSDWDDPVIERSIFGTIDPAEIAAELSQLCVNHLGAEPVSALFYTTSVKAVVGLALCDGRRVVVKVFQPRWSAEFLGAIQSSAAHLAGRGLPCPLPIAGPFPARNGNATFEAFLPEPCSMQSFSGTDMPRMATALAAQVALVRSWKLPAGLSQNPMRVPPGSLYPIPHSPLFDFTRNAARAAWIDDLAQLAAEVKRRNSSPPLVLAHMDWCARNVRLGEDGVAAVYDLDSLAAAPEETAVGQAAASWRLTLEEPGERHPALDEILRYIECYEAARGHRFSERERAAAVASGLWLMTYTARCEHSGDPEGLSEDHSAMIRLRHDGERFRRFLSRFA